MEETDKRCSFVKINKEAASEPDYKARIINMPQRPVLYFFNIG